MKSMFLSSLHQIMIYSTLTTNTFLVLSVVDANYKFLYVDIGCNGRISDGGVFRNSSSLESNSLNIPASKSLPGEVFSLPYIIVLWLIMHSH